MSLFRTTALSCACLCLLGASAQTASAATPTWKTLDGAAPLIIGHRGASGYLPEGKDPARLLAPWRARVGTSNGFCAA